VGNLRGSPFPSNSFTVTDPSQNTGRRVDLPSPDPVTHPSDYEDVQVLNTLDGFNVQPRLSIPFDGPIDVNSVNSNTVFLIRLGDTLNHQDRGGQVVGINQVVWDPATNTLHVESDELLNQHTRYALIVTCGVRDVAGNPVGASEAFRQFRHEVRGDYKHELLEAVQGAHQLGVPEQHIVTASVFTTQSTTAVLEKIRDQIHAATPAPADFLLGPGGTRTVFHIEQVSGLTFNQQTLVSGPLNPVALNVGLLSTVPGTVSQVAFGRYSSPDYLEHPGEYIPPVGTRSGAPHVQGMNELYFVLYLPSGQAPAGGWPVAIFGHGLANSKQGVAGAVNGASMAVAASLAQQGIATIAINAVGHGFGPLSTLTVTPTAGAPVTFSEGGRGRDQNGDGLIGAAEGVNATGPRSIISNRDGRQQTVADLMQLVRVIDVGMDVDGDGAGDLNSSRVYYAGFSFGGMYGALFVAVEPGVRAGVINVAGGAGISDTAVTHQRPGNHPSGWGGCLWTVLRREPAAPRWCAARRSPGGRDRARDSIAGDQHDPRGHADSGGARAHRVGRAGGQPRGVCPSLPQQPARRRPSPAGDHPVRQRRPYRSEPDDHVHTACGRSGRPRHVLPPRPSFRREPHAA
jgi:hypothetical protein